MKIVTIAGIRTALSDQGYTVGMINGPVAHTPDGTIETDTLQLDPLSSASEIADELIRRFPVGTNFYLYRLDDRAGDSNNGPRRYLRYGASTSPLPEGKSKVVASLQSDRKVFYVDVGSTSPEKAKGMIDQTRIDLAKERFINESDNKFTDISSEASRTYNYGQKGFVKINNPIFLSVSSSGGHRIYDVAGVCHYIPSGWIELTWIVREGQPNFVK